MHNLVLKVRTDRKRDLVPSPSFNNHELAHSPRHFQDRMRFVPFGGSFVVRKLLCNGDGLGFPESTQSTSSVYDVLVIAPSFDW